jgi:hypothetical protein
LANDDRVLHPIDMAATALTPEQVAECARLRRDAAMFTQAKRSAQAFVSDLDAIAATSPEAAADVELVRPSGARYAADLAAMEREAAARFARAMRSALAGMRVCTRPCAQPRRREPRACARRTRAQTRSPGPDDSSDEPDLASSPAPGGPVCVGAA